MMTMNKTSIIFFLLLFLMPVCLHSKDNADTLKLTKPRLDRKEIRSTKEKVVEIIEDTITNEYLDTLTIGKNVMINDYSLLGFQYGVGLSRVAWNPTQKQDMLIMPYNIGITYTKYGKMFGFMPYFGMQAGLFLTQEGYQFTHDKDKDYTNKIEGAEKAVMQVVELPVLAHIHVDFWKMKLLFNLGCYAGYRLNIQRYPGHTGSVSESVANSFLETDNRFDYGLKGGVGFGLIFDPIEIHIQGMYKHSFSSLYQPDYYSEFYYRYAYPTNFIISAGVHFQLTKRTGQTKSQLKKLAKEMVYENGSSKNRK